MLFRRSRSARAPLGFTAVLMLCAATSVASATSDNQRARVGRPAPPFLLQRPSGGDVTLATFARRPALLNVYASWCGSCRTEAAGLVAAYRRYGSRVAFLGIDEQEGVGLAASFARDLRVPYPIALDDGQFAATYGSAQIPQTVFIDARGVVRAIGVGAMTPEAIDMQLKRLIAPGDAT